MRNEPNFPKSQMVVTLVLTTNYNEKTTLDTWSKQTQTKPILPATLFGGFVRRSLLVRHSFSDGGSEGGLSAEAALREIINNQSLSRAESRESIINPKGGFYLQLLSSKSRLFIYTYIKTGGESDVNGD
jgi:hypothetical protein